MKKNLMLATVLASTTLLSCGTSATVDQSEMNQAGGYPMIELELTGNFKYLYNVYAIPASSTDNFYLTHLGEGKDIAWNCKTYSGTAEGAQVWTKGTNNYKNSLFKCVERENGNGFAYLVEFNCSSLNAVGHENQAVKGNTDSNDYCFDLGQEDDYVGRFPVVEDGEIYEGIAKNYIEVL